MATLKIIVISSLVIVGLAEHAPEAQGQQCRHRSDGSTVERLRRQAAVKYVAEVNAAQVPAPGDGEVCVSC
jgi:hypothetical protein